MSTNFVSRKGIRTRFFQGKIMVVEPGNLLKRTQGHDVILLVEEIDEKGFVYLRVVDKPDKNRDFKLDEVIVYSEDSLKHFFRYGILELVA